MSKTRTRSTRSIAAARSRAGQKGAATRAANDKWRRLAPADRKGKTKASFVTRSVAARLARRPAKPRTTTTIPPARPRARKSREPDIEPRPTRPTRSRYAVSADYKSRKAGSAVTIQISATGPAGASREDAVSATERKIDTGKSPAGWSIKIVNWRGAKWAGESVAYDSRLKEAWDTLSAPLALAKLDLSPVGGN